MLGLNANISLQFTIAEGNYFGALSGSCAPVDVRIREELFINIY